jgi:polyisoprenoid-binding protein YceI
MRKLPVLLTLFAIAVPLTAQAQETAATTEFRVDSDASWLRVLAWPDGPLKRFGHHHVISHHEISGTVDVAQDPLESSFSLQLAVADLVVDDPDQRALEGEAFEGEVPEEDIEGTRGNMLGERLLNGEQHPLIRIRSNSIEGSMPDVDIVATFDVKGIEQTVTIPASIQLTDDSFTASGELELTHDAFGLSPFTAMGGALSVRDLLVLKYRISGMRVTGDE